MSRRQASTSGTKVSRQGVLAAVASTWCHTGKNEEGLDEYIFTNCSDPNSSQDAHNFKVTGRGIGDQDQRLPKFYRTGERVPVREVMGVGLPEPDDRRVEPAKEFAPKEKRSKFYSYAEQAMIDIENCEKLEEGLEAPRVQKLVKVSLDYADMGVPGGPRTIRDLLAEFGASVKDPNYTKPIKLDLAKYPIRPDESRLADDLKTQWEDRISGVLEEQWQAVRYPHGAVSDMFGPSTIEDRAEGFISRSSRTLGRPRHLDDDVIPGRSETIRERLRYLQERPDDSGHREALKQLMEATLAHYYILDKVGFVESMGRSCGAIKSAPALAPTMASMPLESKA